MAQRSSSGRSATATKARVGNRSPNTPGIKESEISRMRIDEIRGQLKDRGVAGISGQRKDELVKTLVKTLRAEMRQGPTAKKTIAPAKKGAAAKKTVAPAKKGAAAKKTTAPAKKGAAAKKTTVPARKTSTAKRTTAKASGGRGGGSRGPSRSLKYAQRISSSDDQPDRPGRSLVTSEKEVIRRWAEARDAKPATIDGTEREGRPGVLTFDFPGWRSGGRLKQITWEEWFKTFDLRRLNFIYQEQKTNQVQSNFFRLESPDREDA
jgi:hypothetical protein